MPEENIVPSGEEAAEPVADKALVVDADPSNWTLAEQMAYRERVGVNPHYAMNSIGRAMQSVDESSESDEVPDSVLNIPPAYLLGLLWITGRREDKDLSYDALAETTEYGALLNAVIAWGVERFSADPSQAPKRRTARKK